MCGVAINHNVMFHECLLTNVCVLAVHRLVAKCLC
jgi:hypothetical protein